MRVEGKRSALLGLLAVPALAFGVALRDRPSPAGGLGQLLADAERVSGEAAWTGARLTRADARPLSQEQAARVLEALAAAHPAEADGELHLLPAGVATVTLDVGGETVVVEVGDGWTAAISYTLDGAAHRASCDSQLARSSLPDVLRELFPDAEIG